MVLWDEIAQYLSPVMYRNPMKGILFAWWDWISLFSALNCSKLSTLNNIARIVIIYPFLSFYLELTSPDEVILVNPENFSRNKAFSLQLVTKIEKKL